MVAAPRPNVRYRLSARVVVPAQDISNHDGVLQDHPLVLSGRRRVRATLPSCIFTRLPTPWLRIRGRSFGGRGWAGAWRVTLSGRFAPDFRSASGRVGLQLQGGDLPEDRCSYAFSWPR